MARARAVTTLEETTDTDDPVLLRAAGLALAAMRFARVPTYTEMMDHFRADDTGALVCSDEQWQLMARHGRALTGLRLGSTSEGEPSTTIAVCPTCAQFIYVSTGATTPTHCTMTIGCEGAPKKAKAARRVRSPAAAGATR